MNALISAGIALIGAAVGIAGYICIRRIIMKGRKDSIKLVNPYLTLSPRLKKALRKAAERGVKVEIMVSLRSDIPLTPDCVFYNVHRLQPLYEVRQALRPRENSGLQLRRDRALRAH